MNWIKTGASNKVTNKDGWRGGVFDWFMQYGQQEGIQDQWKEIINQTNEVATKTQIDELIKTMENNSDNNGFFCANDDVAVDSMNGFKLDDPELYYLFFENLKVMSNQLKQGDKIPTDGIIIFKSVEKTVKDYLGMPKRNAREQRIALTSVEITDDDEFIMPSIKKQRGQGTGLCTERAAIAHNLWLLAGKTSYFINTRQCELSGDQQYANDGHAFCIVEYDGKFRMCDFALNNCGLMQGNPIQSIKNGEALTFGSSAQNTYVSAALTTEQLLTDCRN